MKQTYCEVSGAEIKKEENKIIIYESDLVNSGDVFDFDNMNFKIEVTLTHYNEFVSARIVSDISDMYEGNTAFREEILELIK